MLFGEVLTWQNEQLTTSSPLTFPWEMSLLREPDLAGPRLLSSLQSPDCPDEQHAAGRCPPPSQKCQERRSVRRYL